MNNPIGERILLRKKGFKDMTVRACEEGYEMLAYTHRDGSERWVNINIDFEQVELEIDKYRVILPRDPQSL